MVRFPSVPAFALLRDYHFEKSYHQHSSRPIQDRESVGSLKCRENPVNNKLLRKKNINYTLNQMNVSHYNL